MRVERAVVDRDLVVAVGADEAVAGEVLAAVVHAGLQQAVHQALAPAAATTRGSRWKARSPITLLPPWSRSSTGVKLRSTPQARSSAREHVAGGARRLERAHRAGAGAAAAVVHPHLAEHAHRRQRGEAVAAEALDAAALVVDADEQVGADRLDLGDQLGQLKAVAPVAREQDRSRR